MVAHQVLGPLPAVAKDRISKLSRCIPNASIPILSWYFIYFPSSGTEREVTRVDRKKWQRKALWCFTSCTLTNGLIPARDCWGWLRGDSSWFIFRTHDRSDGMSRKSLNTTYMQPLWVTHLNQNRAIHFTILSLRNLSCFLLTLF